MTPNYRRFDDPSLWFSHSRKSEFSKGVYGVRVKGIKETKMTPAPFSLIAQTLLRNDWLERNESSRGAWLVVSPQNSAKGTWLVIQALNLLGELDHGSQFFLHRLQLA